MATYVARMMDAASGGEGQYRFEGPDDLMARSPVKVMRHFMEHVTEKGFVEHEDYEIYSALKSKDGAVVTVLGDFAYAPGNHSPFVCMIASKEG